MMRSKQSQKVVRLVIILLLLAGCSQSTPISPTIVPTSSILPTPVSPTATVAIPTTVSNPEQAVEASRIQFQPNTTGWYTNGDLTPKGVLRFVLSAMKGQQMNIWLDTQPVTSDSSLAYLMIKDASGKSLLISPEMYFSNVLTASQDYTIEIHSNSDQTVGYTLRVDIPGKVIDPALGAQYDLIDQTLCQNLQQVATQALGVEFALAARAPFLDEIAGEAGQGCRLTAHGNEVKFTSPQSVISYLAASVGAGWNDQPNYRADGPTGSAAGMTRDMGLMLMKATWAPDMGVVCATDKPISECDLTPEQKIYTIVIDIAQYRASFSLDGHWEDASTGFSLDLNQDWKNIYGKHTIVAQAGNKIDSLDESIKGILEGQAANVQFKSSFATGSGTAQITYIDVNTIHWKILTPPGEEYYLPAEATLTRK